MTIQKPKDSLKAVAQSIAMELLKPENLDLALAVRNFDGEGGFMYGFASAFSRALTFDEFADLQRQLETVVMPALGVEADLIVNMSAAYDDYLRRRTEEQEASPINRTQAERFEAIVMQYDGGWSGAVYGVVCRGVQSFLMGRDS